MGLLTRTPTRDETCNPSRRPDQESNRQPFALQMMLHQLSHTSQGKSKRFLDKSSGMPKPTGANCYITSSLKLAVLGVFTHHRNQQMLLIESFGVWIGQLTSILLGRNKTRLELLGVTKVCPKWLGWSVIPYTKRLRARSLVGARNEGN